MCVLSDEHLMASLSRYATHRFKWPARELDQLALLTRAVGSRFSGWTLFPTGDESAALVSRNRVRLEERFVLTTPSWEIMRFAYDKRETYALAAHLELSHPTTVQPRSVKHLAGIDCQFPAILKPAIKRERSRFTSEKAWLVNSKSELFRRYGEARTMIDPEMIMLQEMIPGDHDSHMSYGALCLDGSAVASIVARRSRQYPIEFGQSSSYVESVDQPEVEESARKILAKMHFTGLAEVEFKRDVRTKELKLLDINPRIWGWHTLGAKAGVDFSYLAWRQANGLPVQGMKARPDVRWIRGSTDCLAAMRMLLRGGLSFRSYMRSFRRPVERAIWSGDDPLPGILEVPCLMIAKLRARRAMLRAQARLAAEH